MRRVLRWVGRVFIIAVLVGFGAAALLAWPQYRTLLAVGAGYMAQTLCSGVLVEGRDPDRVLAEDVLAAADNPALRIYRHEIDVAARTVTAAPLGIDFLGRVAVARPGLGCVLTREDSFAALASRSVPGAPAALDPAAPWPAGEAVAPPANPALVAALDAAFAETGDEALRRTRAIVVVRDGRIVAERYAEGITAETPLLGWSMSKAVTSALAGIAVAEGRIGLDEAPALAAWGRPGDPRGAVTLRHLLGMTDGFAFAEDYGDVTDVSRMLFLADDMSAFVASRPLQFAPGALFSYSTGALNLAMAALEARFPDRAEWLAFPRSRLFGPAGMRSAVFATDAAEVFVGGAYVHATARDWARFGLLLLQEGVINGRRVLPDGWTDFMATPVPGSDGRFGSVLWLDSPTAGSTADLPADTLWLKGYNGQWMAMVPSEGLVVVRLGLTPVETDDLAEAVLQDIRAALAEPPREPGAAPAASPAPEPATPPADAPPAAAPPPAASTA